MSLIDLLQHKPAILAGVAALYGCVAGSFLNVVFHRWPIMRQRAKHGGFAEPYNLAVPRSACPSCGYVLSFWENVPVVSYLVLRGRCRACSVQISPRYLMVEVAMGLSSGVVAYGFGFSWTMLAALLALWVTPAVVRMLHTDRG